MDAEINYTYYKEKKSENQRALVGRTGETQEVSKNFEEDRSENA